MLVELKVHALWGEKKQSASLKPRERAEAHKKSFSIVG